MRNKEKSEKNDVSLVNFTDDELRTMRDEALSKYDEIIEQWSKELNEITSQKGFDQYSRKGEKLIDKLNTKYADPLTDAEIVLETIQEELNKRENYYEQQRYMDSGNYTSIKIEDEEFLKREKEKTDRIRQILDDNE